MEDDIKALREEIAKLRERVAVLEAADAPLRNIREPLNVVRQQWTQVPFSDQYMPAWAQPVPPGSPFTITG